VRSCRDCVEAKRTHSASCGNAAAGENDGRCATPGCDFTRNTGPVYLSRKPAQNLDWPPYPTPTDQQEQFLIPVLLPGIQFPGTKTNLIRELRAAPLTWEGLSGPAKDAVEKVCRELGVDVRQACGLRKTVYKSSTPWKFQGGEAEALAKAEALKRDVESYLSRNGVKYETQQEGFRKEGVPFGPTPDFRILSPLCINGDPVRWIEVKNYYGAGLEAGIKPWMPTIKVQEQIAKYIHTLGSNGAVVYAHGYGEGLRRRTPQTVQLLDAGQLYRHKAGYDSELKPNWLQSSQSRMSGQRRQCSECSKVFAPKDRTSLEQHELKCGVPSYSPNRIHKIQCHGCKKEFAPNDRASLERHESRCRSPPSAIAAAGQTRDQQVSCNAPVSALQHCITTISAKRRCTQHRRQANAGAGAGAAPKLPKASSAAAGAGAGAAPKSPNTALAATPVLPQIVLLRPWDSGYNDSWLVSYDGPYSNDRPPHIAVGQHRMTEFHSGQRLSLQNRHTVGPATMWDVTGTDAHFTVDFRRRY
jgi:hypothetical protein